MEIDLSEIHTWTKKTTIGKPSDRYAHEMASIYGDDKVVLFGGYLNYVDTWIYDVSDNNWTQKNPINKPIARQYFAMASIYGDDKVVLFGGEDNSINFYDDTWVYDLSNNTWTQNNQTNKPSARAYHGMASIYGDDKVVLFGGYDAFNGNYNETWVYDLSQNKWTQKSPANAPSPRNNLAMTSIYADDKIFLFGGRISAYVFTNDTWIYDLSNDSWIQMYPMNRPKTRGYHVLASIPGTDRVMVFGGFHSRVGPILLNDTWIYDLSNNNWINNTPKNGPSERYFHAVAEVYGQDKIVLLGGKIIGLTFGDTWIYKHFIALKNGTFISKPFDTESNSSFDTISWYAKTPENTRIKLQLKTADNESNLNLKAFIGPDGTGTTFYTLKEEESIYSGHTGDRWVQYKAYLNISEIITSPSLKEVTISYNCLPETLVVGPKNESLLTVNKPVFKWTFVDYDSQDQKAFQVQIAKDIAFEELSFDTGEQISADETWEFPTGTSYTELPDGTWYWKIRTKDEDDAWTEYSEPWLFVVDTQSPSSSPIFPINNGFYNSLNKISGLANDPVPGSEVIKVEIAINDLNTNYYWNGSAWAPFVSWLLASGTYDWTYDSSNITWLSGNQYNVQSRAIDLANHIELPDLGNLFTIDLDDPVSYFDNIINDTWLNKLHKISGRSFDDGGSGVDKVELSIQRVIDNMCWDGANWNPIKTWLQTLGIERWTYNSTNVEWSSGYQYLIRSRATDISMNVEVPNTGIFINFDAVPPDDLAIFINDDEEFTSSAKVTLSLQAYDRHSGVVDMAFCLDGKDWQAWQDFNSSISFELPIGDGEKYVYYKVTDRAGNIAEHVFDSIVLDATQPESLSLVINYNEEFTNSNVVTLSIYAIDTLSGISDISFSFNSVIWEPWELYKTTGTITIPEHIGEGNRRIYFRARDKAGNIAEPVYDSIILDRTPPKLLFIIINGNSTETNSTQISLRLNAIDTLSGVDNMSFSMDNRIWSEWENYSEFKVFDLPSGDGERVIYYRAKDAAGNIAEPVSSSIILNTTTLTTKPDKQPGAKEDIIWDLNIWVLLIIIVIILMILLAIGAILIKKRKKRPEQEKLLQGALTVKPGTLINLATSPSQLSYAPAQPQLLPVSTATTPTQPTPSIQTAPAPTPIQPPQPVPKVVSTPQLPQLPPAQIQETKPEEGLTPLVPTFNPSLTPTTQLQPSPQVTPTPTISEPSKPQTAPTPQPKEAVAQQPSTDKTKKLQSEQAED